MKLQAFSKELRVTLVVFAGSMLSACGGQSPASSTEDAQSTSSYNSITTVVRASPVVLAASTLPSGSGASGSLSLVSASAEVIADALTTLRIESINSAGDQTNIPFTFGQVFAQGDLPSAYTLIGKFSDGTLLPLQVDVKATHPDGSTRHAIISAVLPKLSAAQAKSIGLVKVAKTVNSAGASTPQDLINAGFTASVNINLGGQTYTASADTLLKNGKYTSWIAGSVANEWLASAPLKTSQGVDHPHLTARFAIRAYPGLNKARVDVTIENNWAHVSAPQNFTYDTQIIVGGQTVYSKSALTHYHHARWRKTFWWGSAPQVHVRHDTSYLLKSKAVPNYDQTFTISAAAINTFKNAFTGAAAEPMGNGLAVPYMPQTGGRPDIGLMPGWAVMYLLNMDKDSKAFTLGSADLAGSWSAHYRDKNTDRPVSLVDYPYMTILGRASDTVNPVTRKAESFPDCGGVCTNANTADASHEPSFAYLPYLVTGDYYYLEELQFWAMWNLFQSNPGYRENVKGLIHSDQVRGQAWKLRTLAEAAYITPDNDVFKAQFEKFLSNNLDWYNTTYSNNPAPANNLGVLNEANAIVYDGGVGIAPWQDDFFTSAVGFTAELGFAKAQPLLLWKARFPVSRMVSPDFCWVFGSVYNLHIKSSASSAIYPNIGMAYQATNPSLLASLACASSTMASKLGLKVGEMVGYSSENTGYPSNMQPALAYSAASGIANGANAWKAFMNRTVKPNYSTGPQFAIVPR